MKRTLQSQNFMPKHLWTVPLYVKNTSDNLQALWTVPVEWHPFRAKDAYLMMSCIQQPYQKQSH